jgi:hypothetical protein
VSEDTLASAARSTNTAWSHDMEKVLGTHSLCSLAGVQQLSGHLTSTTQTRPRPAKFEEPETSGLAPGELALGTCQVVAVIDVAPSG